MKQAQAIQIDTAPTVMSTPTGSWMSPFRIQLASLAIDEILADAHEAGDIESVRILHAFGELLRAASGASHH